MGGNWFSYFVLFSWPGVVIYVTHRYSVKKAILWSLIGEVLFLPVKLSVDFPFLPPLDKSTITNLTLFGTLLLAGKKLRVFQSGLINKLLIVYSLSLFISAELNNFPVYLSGKVLPGLTHYDAFSASIRFYISFMPFILARRFLNHVNDNGFIFKTLTLTGLFYSVLMLFEIRMSPQLHTWIYGYSPTEFVQNMRGGGFRPVVFVGHGLPLAFLFSTFLLVAFALLKNKVRVTQFSPFTIVCYMSVVLVLCKTWSAVAYAFIGLILMHKAQPKTQVKIAAIMASFALFFPLARTINLFPTQELIDFIAEFSGERAQSLGFRFDNEDILLKRAMEHPFFGWGGWGRNRIYDDVYGKDISVTDGRWIIELGINGLVGFISYFGLLITPIFYSVKAIKRVNDHRHKVYIATQALLLGFCMIDLLPNNNMGPIHLLLAGSLLGQSEQIIKQRIQNRKKPIVGNGKYSSDANVEVV